MPSLSAKASSPATRTAGMPNARARIAPWENPVPLSTTRARTPKARLCSTIDGSNSRIASTGCGTCASRCPRSSGSCSCRSRSPSCIARSFKSPARSDRMGSFIAPKIASISSTTLATAAWAASPVRRTRSSILPWNFRSPSIIRCARTISASVERLSLSSRDTIARRCSASEATCWWKRWISVSGSDRWYADSVCEDSARCCRTLSCPSAIPGLSTSHGMTNAHIASDSGETPGTTTVR